MFSQRELFDDFEDYCERHWFGDEARPVNTEQFNYTLDEVAKELGVTRERARQIESEALKKCQKWCLTHGYKMSDLL